MRAGLQAKRFIHGVSGAAAAHHRGLLEDDLGMEKLLDRNADRAGGERTGREESKLCGLSLWLNLDLQHKDCFLVVLVIGNNNSGSNLSCFFTIFRRSVRSIGLAMA